MRKCQTTVYRPYKGADYVRVVMKGAPEVVMTHCTKILNQSGEHEYLHEAKRDVILKDSIITKYSCAGYRSFVYAYKDINSDDWENLQAEHNNFIIESDRFIVEEDLTFLAAFALEDDLRPGVEKSIKNLQDAKIRVRMLSGDNLETAM